MQILHPFAGSVTQYAEEISDPDRYRPDHCPQCHAKQPLIGHGFYQRTLVDAGFDGVISVRRYLCRLCKRTVSLLPEFALPWLRFSITVISLFLVARLLQGLTLAAAAQIAFKPPCRIRAGSSGSPFSRSGAVARLGADAAGHRAVDGAELGARRIDSGAGCETPEDFRHAMLATCAPLSRKDGAGW